MHIIANFTERIKLHFHLLYACGRKNVYTHMHSLLFMLKQSPCRMPTFQIHVFQFQVSSYQNTSFVSKAWWEFPREAATEENRIKFWSLSSKVWPGHNFENPINKFEDLEWWTCFVCCKRAVWFSQHRLRLVNRVSMIMLRECMYNYI